MALFLVNLPFVHETWTDHQLEAKGRDVEATVIDARRSGGNYLLDYQLPRSVDPDRTRFSARVDEPTFELAERSHAMVVRVVPGKPASNRPEGAITTNLFAVVAAIGDLVLLLVLLVGYRRWRQRSLYVVESVNGDEATLRSPHGHVTVIGPPGWAARVRPGQRVSGRLHLMADHEVLPGSEVGGLEQVRGSSYVVKGRVVDTRAGRVDLELEDKSRLRVETGPHHIRADIRDPTEVRGTLCFTPGGLGG
jgi:hypothetical protein